MVTIEHVEVTFEVEGDDEDAFRRHFQPAIERWYRAVQARERDERESARDRSLSAPEAR
jgi:hypothetical protein